MHVLVAPDSFTGTLSAAQAAAAIAEGWHRHAPDDVVELCPLSDGGPGFLDVLKQSLGGDLLSIMSTGLRGEQVSAGVLLVTGADGTITAYLESAQVCGLHLVPERARDPGATTTVGLAGLLIAARAAGAGRIVVGLGGSGTNDGGAGLLAGLGVGAGQAGVLARGGSALLGLGADDLAGLAQVRASWSELELVVAGDVDSPLLGFHGASAGYAAQKGATAEQAQELERALGDFAAAVVAAGAADRTLAAAPGAGAAGGLGYALLLLGAGRVSGAQAVVDAVKLQARVAGSDLVITGEGCFDWQSLRGKVITGVARCALETGTPAVVIAGQVLVGRREMLAIGIESAYPVGRTPAQIEASLARPAQALAARAERVARTWSR